MRKLELLAPAKNTDTGIEAIRHGADAVYIGAPKFGARAAAGNSIEDIKRLVDYAHQFMAKVYVTINTILNDNELEEARKLIWELYRIGVDALIVQDMGLTQVNLPPIELHASTQMDNRTPEKVKYLWRCGFRQVVLARELTLNEIREIHEACPEMALEVFVHGALCVSYSGQCYASECLFGRSANRGECAQVCRMTFDLIHQSSDGKQTTERILAKQKHLLSLKDMCQLNALQKLAEAGVTSFKVEGRLKEMSYVKNVTAAYSEALNRIVRNNQKLYERASVGKVELMFEPDVVKSFNRGFTDYFLNGRNDQIFSFNTPKAIGEEVGYVKDIFRTYFTVAGLKSFSNGDGLCFVDPSGNLFGFRVNKVENGKLYPLEMPKKMLPKTRLYRNFDKKFEDILQRESAERFIPVDIDISETQNGFHLTMKDDYGMERAIDVECEKELARTHQTENIERQLSKMGGTIFKLRHLKLNYRNNWFIPSSMLSDWRRQLTDSPYITESPERKSSRTPSEASLTPGTHLTYLANVMNTKAKQFYEEQGADQVDWAYEMTHPKDVAVMYCKHCIRYSMGWCQKNPKARNGIIPQRNDTLFLHLSNGKRFRLVFDCRNCIMKLYPVNETTL